ncbi:hypothetical protein QJS10_CPB13g01120 [Acorus calamus]|uniref:Reverse transcriptase domain-containing protein n=1 Tax=Acorus calamus TaxID=4465 RepID=A0AAV9DIS4_ACOCL|nr:hypothetical protein QJS10_CPB13g01120 [Acorus calamus]
MESFSNRLDKLCAEGEIGSYLKYPLNITHLSFADDLLLFVDATAKTALAIKQIFLEFSSISGLQLNPSKSQVFSNSNTKQFCQLLGIPQCNLPVRYLGMPMFTGALSHCLCQPLIDKIQQRIQSWAVSKPLKEGGLGIKSIQKWNKGAQGVRYWDIASDKPSLLATWVKKRYLRSSRIWNHIPSSSSSSSWKHIIAARSWIADMGGPSTSGMIHWLNGKSLKDLLGRESLIWGPPQFTSFSVLIQEEKWCKLARWHSNLDVYWDEINQLDVGGMGPDILVWPPSRSGALTLRHAWEAQSAPANPVLWADWLWLPVQSRRQSFTAWQFFLDKLPTRDRLLRKVWEERNSRIFRGKVVPKSRVLRYIKSDIRLRFRKTILKAAPTSDILQIAENFESIITEPIKSQCKVLWVPPTPGWIKSNSDGSLSEDRGGYGALLRDTTSNLIVGVAGSSPLPSINLLELKGIQTSLLLSIQHGYNCVWFESDSTTAIAWMKGRGRQPWTALRLLRKISQGILCLEEWKITHIFREGNSQADILASTRRTMGEHLISPLQVWQELEVAINSDKAGTQYSRQKLASNI